MLTATKSADMTVTTDEFLRRFLLHVLPRGFVRIRHFGFLSAPATARAHRCLPPAVRRNGSAALPHADDTPSSLTTWPCPCCGGAMIIIEKLTAKQIHLRSEEWKNLIDSS